MEDRRSLRTWEELSKQEANLHPVITFAKTFFLSEEEHLQDSLLFFNFQNI